MTPAKRPRFEDDAADLPLDLSMEKVERIVRESECVESSKVSSDKTDNDKATTSLVVPVPVSGTSLPLLSSFRHLGLFGLRLPEVTDPFHCNIPESLLAIECKLTENIHEIEFGPPIEYMYNPIKYAFEVHSEYVHKYCRTSKKLLFLGMNAGPWGMSQTGVPFGEINAVTKWLQLSGFIGKPVREHPARKVTGFACKRSEVSGRRFWNLIENVCGTPDKFFRHSFLHNYCPIALMDAAGRNITPADLKAINTYILHALFCCIDTVLTWCCCLDFFLFFCRARSKEICKNYAMRLS